MPLDRDEQERLITSHRDYGRERARIFWRKHKRWGTLDDFEAAALEGLWRAARKFDPDRGVLFPTYAKYWVRQCMQRWLSRSIGVAANLWWEDAELCDLILRRINFDPDSPIADELEASEHDGRDIDAFWADVEERLKDQPRYLRVILMRFRDGKSVRRIVRDMGLSAPDVVWTYAWRACKRLKVATMADSR